MEYLNARGEYVAYALELCFFPHSEGHVNELYTLFFEFGGEQLYDIEVETVFEFDGNLGYEILRKQFREIDVYRIKVANISKVDALEDLSATLQYISRGVVGRL